MNTYTPLKVILVMFLLPLLTSGQGIGINSDGSIPDASSILDVKSTDKGVLLPRLTSAQMNAIAFQLPGC
jgi:hypothetical protein